LFVKPRACLVASLRADAVHVDTLRAVGTHGGCVDVAQRASAPSLATERDANPIGCP
jgi:hypothetical protein